MRIKTWMFTLATLIQRSFVSPNHRNPNWKRSKTVTEDYMILHKKMMLWHKILEKNMHASFPMKTPKLLQLAAEQLSTGEYWIPPKKKIPYVQGQRRGPSRTVGGAKSHLESNLLPTRDAHRDRTNLCSLGPRDFTETQPELCLSASCEGMGQQWPAAGVEALGAAHLGLA